MAQTVKNLPEMQETLVQSLGWKIPWRRKWLPTAVFLPGEFLGQRSLVGYSHEVAKSQTRMLRDQHFHFHRISVKLLSRVRLFAIP